MNPRIDRRRLLETAAGGTILFALGGCYRPATSADVAAANAHPRPDGRQRIPPGQYLLKGLKPMGGQEGEASPAKFRLKVHGAVEKPLDLSFRELLAFPQVEQDCDIHCVTRWSVLDSHWKGVQLTHLADLAGVKDSAAYVIFEAAYGYTSNVPLKEALRPQVLVAHELWGDPLRNPNGAPVRALVPDLYFWKSAKWLTGIRFQSEDEPGYWETRGYNNHADPWKEERYA
jgi:DMSO/TMAO reductase YedYZ molybdopterin-dependent catalytic subunit